MDFKEFFDTNYSASYNNSPRGSLEYTLSQHKDILLNNNKELLEKFLKYVVKDAYDKVMEILPYCSHLQEWMNSLRNVREFLNIPEPKIEPKEPRRICDLDHINSCLYYAQNALGSNFYFANETATCIHYASLLSMYITADPIDYRTAHSKYFRYLIYLLSNKTLKSDHSFSHPFKTKIKSMILHALENNDPHELQIALNDMTQDYGGTEFVEQLVQWMHHIYQIFLPSFNNFTSEDWNHLIEIIFRYKKEFIEFFRDYHEI